MTKKTVLMSVAGQPLNLDLASVLTVLLHKDDMEVKSDDPGVKDITPEMTVAMANEVLPEDWKYLREEPNFKRLWAGLWEDKPLPEKLETLAAKHTTGLIFLILEALSEDKVPHLLYPETYLHPAQQRMFSSFLTAFHDPEKDEEAVV